AAFDGSNGSHLRQGNEAAGGNPAESVLDAVDGFFPDGLSEPDLEAVDLEPAPAPGEEMTELVNEDDDVENHQDDEDQQGDLEESGKSRHVTGWETAWNLAPSPTPASSLKTAEPAAAGRVFRVEIFPRRDFSLCKPGWHPLVLPPAARQNGDCSSVVEPRIVIPVVAGSIPVNHPIFPAGMLK